MFGYFSNDWKLDPHGPYTCAASTPLSVSSEPAYSCSSNIPAPDLPAVEHTLYSCLVHVCSPWLQSIRNSRNSSCGDEASENGCHYIIDTYGTLMTAVWPALYRKFFGF
jgi:hypothetical protein